MENKVNINYILDIPFNDSLKEEYNQYMDNTGNIDDGYKNHLIERFFKDSVKDILENVRKDYHGFDGKFILDIRNNRIIGMFQSTYQVRGSLDEPLRREFFDRFRKMTKSDDLRVDINMSCVT